MYTLEPLEQRVMLSAIPGDANLDGTVDGADYDIWFTHLQTSATSAAQGDFNGDHFVDGADHDIWFTHLGQRSGIDVYPGLPSDIGSYTVYSGATLAGFDGVVTMSDFIQYRQADCWLITWAAANPLVIANAVKAEGTGFVVTFNKGGTITRVHVTAELPTWFKPINGSIICGIFEKAEAYYRRGTNQYASLDYGWNGEPAAHFNVPSMMYNANGAQVSVVTSWLKVNINKKLTVATSTNATALVPSHAYNVKSLTYDASGAMIVNLRNPWGFQDASITVNTLIAQAWWIYYTP